MKEFRYETKTWLFLIVSLIGAFYCAVTAAMMGWLTVFAENPSEIEMLHLKGSMWGGLFLVCLILSIGQIFALITIYKKK